MAKRLEERPFVPYQKFIVLVRAIKDYIHKQYNYQNL